MRLLGIMLSFGMLVSVMWAQNDDLVVNHSDIVSQVNAFGIEEQLITGTIRNTGDSAYENVQIFANVLNRQGEVIGEGFGFLTDQCGEAILDAPLQPDQTRAFMATLDLYQDDPIETIEIVPQGSSTDPEALPERDVTDSVTRIAGGEVVRVEWEGDNTLLYGIGCERDLFTEYDWYRYQVDTAIITPLDQHPAADLITDSFIDTARINIVTQGGGTDDSLINSAYLTFPQQSSRAVFQTDIHTLVTAELDGSFRRVVHDRLSQFSLQGFVWSPLGNFVATYFGAYGEPVQYLTASAQQGLLSALLPNNTPSVTMPGITDDGMRVIIGGTFPDAESAEEITGYWLSSVVTQRRELLFAVETLPGNNYPAPAYRRVTSDQRYIYVIRPIEDVPTLQCYYREGATLTTLTELPLYLSSDERAWSFLSPDGSQLAIAATGDHGGLWVVSLDGCE